MGIPRSRLRLRSLAWMLVLPVVSGGAYGGDGSVVGQMGASAGARRYRPDRWGVVAVESTNMTDESAELLSVIYFADDPTLQYGRRTWVPPHSTLKVTCPVRVPGSVSPSKSSMDMVLDYAGPVGGSVVEGRSRMEVMTTAKPLILDHDPLALGILGDFESVLPFGDDSRIHEAEPVVPSIPDDPVYEIVVAAKASEDLSRRVSIFDTGELPATSASLDALDVLVLSSDRIEQDVSGMAQLRNWVLEGGHLWIMLDEVGEGTVASILGDAFSSTIVDRVELTELAIANPETGDVEGESLTFEEPVSFVRVLPGDALVTATVDGWPASMWQPFGAGAVYYTTVGPRGWMRPRRPDDEWTGRKGFDTVFVARDPLKRFASACLRRGVQPDFDETAIEPFLTRQIGYRILSRNTVSGVLLAFCGIVGLSGLWLLKIGRLERIVWVAPAAAGVASLVFLGVAASARRMVPPTAATFQRIVLEAGVNTGHAEGLASLYNPQASRETLGATRGGVFFPDMTAMTGDRRRMIWTDENAWHWEELQLPPGVRIAPLEHLVHLEETVDCRARFGPAGLVGTLAAGPLSGLGDCLIVNPGHPMAGVRMEADGSFTSGTANVMARSDFIAGNLLSDVQRRRAEVYSHLLADRGVDNRSVERPVLFAWADGIDAGFDFPQPNRLGSALLSVPLRMERTAPGTEVTIPASFVGYRSVIGPDGDRPSAYSNALDQWAEYKEGAIDWLRFQIPESVLPIDLKRATVTLEIRAPSRSVELIRMVEGTPAVVGKWSHPIGEYRLVLNRPEQLTLDEKGGLLLAIRVGEDETVDPADTMAKASWQVGAIRLEAAGEVLKQARKPIAGDANVRGTKPQSGLTASRR